VHIDDRFDSARTEDFSDGVFAIAITLLVLEISVPLRDFDDLWRGIRDQWPSYLAYVTSFMTIGGLWLAHHGIFRRLQYANQTVTRLNLLLLMGISFLPFPTKLMAEALHEHAGERPAVLFYGAALFIITSIMTAMGRYAAREDLTGGTVDRQRIRRISNRTGPSLGFYGLVIFLAFFAPRAAVYGFLAVAIAAVLNPR
jgi:uncharacterized membrane protein